MECIFVMACHEKFTIYDFFKKKVLKVLKVNPRHITLGPHNIHVNFF
jgi:hypothetical protein